MDFPPRIVKQRAIHLRTFLPTCLTSLRSATRPRIARIRSKLTDILSLKASIILWKLNGEQTDRLSKRLAAFNGRSTANWKALVECSYQSPDTVMRSSKRFVEAERM